jgi:hypothetical protein
MIGVEEIGIAATVGTIQSPQPAVDAEPGPTDTPLLSRLLLALLLTAGAVLVPGEATRFLDAPLEWSDLCPDGWRSPLRISFTAVRRAQSGRRPATPEIA